MVELEVTDLRKEFGSLVAVDDINFTADDNEFITIVGPSGSGKTTVIRMIAGLEDPTSGTIRFGDRDLTHTMPQERDVAMMFQDIALYPHMSVRENMAYGLKIAGVDKSERNSKVEDVAEMLQITDQLDKNPSELSGGQQQRVALGRSIVRDPSIFLFDEPMSDLDAKLKRELRPVVSKVADELDCPMIYVTHDQEEAMTMSDKIIVMRDGEIVQSGTPEEVYRNPETIFTGEFIGQPEMQFLEGELCQTDNGASVTTGDYQLSVPNFDGATEYFGSEIVLGIRPQHLSVEHGGKNGGLRGRHKFDEPLGDRTISFFDTDVGRIVVVTDAAFRGQAGEEYSIMFETSEIKIFDPVSEQRIC
jgi:multiple sugar transport system ATP-binding protein